MSENNLKSTPSQFRTFLARYLSDMSSGLVGGAVVGFIAPTLVQLARKFYWGFLWRPSERLEGICVWPAHWLPTLVTIAFISCALFGILSYKILRRVWSSWRAGLLSGAFISWALTAALAFSLINLTGQTFYLGLLALPLTVAIATFRRDALLGRTEQETAEVNLDRSISQPTEDMLSRGPVVSSLLRAVISDRSPIVALTGTYGDGKTSVLNLLTKALEERGDVTVVPFAAWLPMDEETLVATLFSSIIEKLETNFFVPSVRRNFRRFSRVLFAVLPGVPTSVKDLFEKPSQSKQIAELRRSLSRVPVRVAVLLDDMDRMHKNELGTLLKLLRGVPEFPQFTYVCAFDPDALTRTLQLDSSRESRIDSQQYLEKFFPDRIPLPRIEDSILLGEFNVRFQKICDLNNLLLDNVDRTAFLNNWRTTWQTMVRQYITNLRRLNLFTNRIGRLLRVVGEEINLKDLLLLELVRMLDPVMYEEIFRNPNYFMFSHWRESIVLQGLFPDKEEARKRSYIYFEALFKALPPPPEGILVGLLAEIFPSVMSYLKKKEISPDPLRSERERRIFHPDFFFRYFILQVPNDIFGEKQLVAFIESMNRASNTSVATELYKSKYAELRDSQLKRLDFLRRVDLSISRFSPLPLKGMLTAVSELSEEFDNDSGLDSESASSRRLIFTAAGQLGSNSTIETALCAVIKDSGSDIFPTNVLNDITMGRRRVSAEVHSADKTKFLQAFSQRMQAKYGFRKGLSKFTGENELEIVSLGRWAQCGPESREQVQDYLQREFRSRHANLGKFLVKFFPGPDTEPDTGPRLDPLRAIEIYFPVSVLREMVDEFASGSYSSEGEETAVRQFQAKVDATRNTNG